MNYQAIYEDRQLLEYSNLSPAEFATSRNTPLTDAEHTEWRDVPMTEVLNYFVHVNPSTQTAVWDKLALAVTNTNYNGFLRAAINRLLVTAQSNIPVLNYRTAELVDYLPYVVMLGIVTQAEADGFLDLSRVYKSDAQLNYGSDITEQDVLIADLTPRRMEWEAERNLAADRLAFCEAKLADCMNGIDPGEVE